MTSRDNTPGPADLPAGESPELDDRWISLLDTALRAQAPVARRYVQGLRAKKPGASTEELMRVLTLRYSVLATGTGAGIGGVAAMPGIGTATALGLTVGEGLVFAEASAFLTLAAADIHDVDMRDAETHRLVLMAVLSGERGAEIIAKSLGQQGMQWSSVLGGGGVVPGFVTRQVSRYVRRRVLARTSGIWLGRLLPFGVGAVIGGVGARLVSRSVVDALEEIFEEAPETLQGSARPAIED